jgi:saccharopine dehydrogenase (NADP+, L-glutamate forming)
MKKILLLGAGKSTTCLIDYIIKESGVQNWELLLADANLEAAQQKVGGASHARAIQLNADEGAARKELVGEADLVISLLPPAMHYLIAKDCISSGKNLLTASYVDDQISSLRPEIEDKKLLFICELGLDPGIDHMSAMEIIHRIHASGGKINSFRSHTGGLVAPESDNNPWHYKISWNPRNVVLAGKAGATYKLNGQIIQLTYSQLFESCQQLSIPDLGAFAYYPNRDSLSYIPVYGLEEASTFLRTTLRYPDFCENWKWIVKAGLTDDRLPKKVDGLHFNEWSKPIRPWINKTNEESFSYLGFFSDQLVPSHCVYSADILQWLLETKLSMQPNDKDMIVMLHEFDYELNGRKEKLTSHLVVKGEDHIRTAMAKTVGLPLGIAAKLILQDKINLTGLHIPILPAIYLPLLMELRTHGILFTEEIS